MPAPIRVPEDDTLSDAIAPQNQVKMIVIGSEDRCPQIAEWAGQVADNAKQPGGFNARRPIWITDPASVSAELTLIVKEPYPTVLVLNRDDSVSGQITDDGDNIDPAVLDFMYLQAGS